MKEKLVVPLLYYTVLYFLHGSRGRGGGVRGMRVILETMMYILWSHIPIKVFTENYRVYKSEGEENAPITLTPLYRKLSLELEWKPEFGAFFAPSQDVRTFLEGREGCGLAIKDFVNNAVLFGGGGRWWWCGCGGGCGRPLPGRTAGVVVAVHREGRVVVLPYTGPAHIRGRSAWVENTSIPFYRTCRGPILDNHCYMSF
jgi:hypothetical protein